MKIIFVILFCLSPDLVAALVPSKGSLDDLVTKILSQRYSKSRIELKEVRTNLKGNPEIGEKLTLLRDSPKGLAEFDLNGRARVWVRYSAWMKVPVAKHRIYPKKKISKELFQIKEIDVAQGTHKQMRKLILPFDFDFSNLETRQSILAGHYPLLSSVQKIHDVKRGDSVRVLIRSGSLVLSTSGTAQEPAYVGDTLTITAAQTKQKLSGVLKPQKKVEVTL